MVGGWGAVSGVVAMLREFVFNCQRVLVVTHKPVGEEFWHIAKATALGTAVIGVVGLIVTMVAFALAVLR